MIKAWQLLVSLVFASALISSSAEATILAAGGSGSPDTFSLGFSFFPPAGQSVRTVAGATSQSWAQGSFTGLFYAQVESDPGNVFCPGCFDFIFQVQNTSAQNITRITQNGFSAYQVDVGYDTISVGSLTLCGPDDNGFCNSGKSSTVPTSVDRSSDGDVVGFDLPGVVPFDSTVDLVIETNSLSFIDPTMTIVGSNGGIATLNVFGPSGPPVGVIPVSEPPSAWLLALGLLGVLGLGKRLNSASATK